MLCSKFARLFKAASANDDFYQSLYPEHSLAGAKLIFFQFGLNNDVFFDVDPWFFDILDWMANINNRGSSAVVASCLYQQPHGNPSQTSQRTN